MSCVPVRGRRQVSRWSCFFMALLCPTLTLLAGCGLSREEPIPFRATAYALQGQVLRSGVPLTRQTVKLYDDLEATYLDSVVTDDTGHYGFGSAPAGGVMVKVTSLRPGDFRYVRYIFQRTSAASRDSVPPLDVWAYGCRLLAPEEGANLEQPSPSLPLEFTWTPMTGMASARYRVRLVDTADTLVWESSRDLETTASFNGIGTNAEYAGQFVSTGTFNWRVKVRLPNDVSAATEERGITFRPASGDSVP
jgi:hypothetical protein